MELKINEVAKLTGITVRTLHYYDEIGLLKPSEITEAGYRLYNEQALAELQQILFFRELDFSLNDIRKIMTSPAFDQTKALKKHKELLLEKRSHLDSLIQLVEKTMKGMNTTMEMKVFDLTEIENHKKQYAKEVQERWGETSAYQESEEKTSIYNDAQWQMVSGEGNNIFKAFADNMDKAVERPEVQALVKRWQDFITERFYYCSNEILSCLGLMYIGDSRFTENIDKIADGLAQFVSDAIKVYCEK